SLPLPVWQSPAAFSLSVLPWQFEARCRHGDNSLLAAGKSQSFAGCCLHCYSRWGDCANLSDALPHGRNMRADPRRLTNDGKIEIDYAPAARRNETGGM